MAKIDAVIWSPGALTKSPPPVAAWLFAMVVYSV